MTYLMSNIMNFLSKVSLGIGLSYSSVVFLMILSLFFPLNNLTGPMAFLGYFSACGFVYLYVLKKSFKFDSSMVPKVCLGVFISAVSTFVLMLQVSSIPVSLPSFFAVSMFLAIGLIGIYGDRQHRKLGFCFMALGLLFLVCVPIVNVWQIRGGYGHEGYPFYYDTIYDVYTIPLILASFAFFGLGSILILYRKSQTQKMQKIDDGTLLEQERFSINFGNLGFSFMVFSQLSLVCAAIVYAQRGLRSWEFSTHPSTALQFVVVAAVLFTLGFSFMLKNLGLIISEA